MRVIRQDGRMDMPYEQIVLERVNDTIYSLVGSAISGWVEETAESYVMAEYSTEEKAIIENTTRKTERSLMHKQYASRFIRQYLVEREVENEVSRY